MFHSLWKGTEQYAVIHSVASVCEYLCTLKLLNEKKKKKKKKKDKICKKQRLCCKYDQYFGVLSMKSLVNLVNCKNTYNHGK